MIPEQNISIEDVMRVLEQQFPKELTIAVQQVKIALLEKRLAEGHHHEHSEV